MDMKCIFGVTGSDTSARTATGRRVVEALVRELGVVLQPDDDLGASIGRTQISSGELLLMIPHGELAQNGLVWERAAQRYQLSATDTLVVYDEVDMAFGMVDLTDESAETKQPGMISINQHGGADAWRLRIGTQSSIQGCLPDDVFSAVSFSDSGIEQLESDIIPRTLDEIQQFCANT